MTEDQLLTTVLDLCGYLPVRTVHFRPALTAKGYCTAVQGDGKGWPDLVIVSRHGVLWRELKDARRQLEPEQRVWRAALLDAGQDWAIWRPADLTSGRIEAELKALAKGEARV